MEAGLLQLFPVNISAEEGSMVEMLLLSITHYKTCSRVHSSASRCDVAMSLCSTSPHTITPLPAQPDLVRDRPAPLTSD